MTEMEKLALGLYVVRHDGADATDPPEDVGIVIEGCTVLRDLREVTNGCAVLFGLIYCLNLSYPMELRYFRISSGSVNGIGWMGTSSPLKCRSSKTNCMSKITCTRQDWTWPFVDCCFIFGLLLDKVKLWSIMFGISRQDCSWLI